MKDAAALAGHIAQSMSKDAQIQKTGHCPDCGKPVSPEQHQAHKASQAGLASFYGKAKKGDKSPKADNDDA